MQSEKLLKLKERGAVLSPDRMYRYGLIRLFNDGPWVAPRPPALQGPRLVNFICLNPSTADETKPDPTLTRCVNYAKAWGMDGVVMTNLFAFRSSKPNIMMAAEDPVGEENDEWVKDIATHSFLRIAGWGCDGKFKSRGEEVIRMLGGHLKCLGQNNDGTPKHPLYLKKDLKPQRMRIKATSLDCCEIGCERRASAFWPALEDPEIKTNPYCPHHLEEKKRSLTYALKDFDDDGLDR